MKAIGAFWTLTADSFGQIAPNLSLPEVSCLDLSFDPQSYTDRRCNIVWLLRMLPNLEEIYLSYRIACDMLPFIMRDCRKLKRLVCKGCRGLIPSAFETVHNEVQITELYLDNARLITYRLDAFSRYMFSGLRNLERLSIKNAILRWSCRRATVPSNAYQDGSTPPYSSLAPKRPHRRQYCLVATGKTGYYICA